jgi:DNA-binding NarL/FixJ family response regulator
MSSKKISVVIADDHHIFRKGLLSILKDDDTFNVIDEAANGKDALDIIKQKLPDIALLDIDMPGLNGLEVVKEINASGLDTKIIILTIHKDKAYFQRSREMDVKAFILKDSIADDLTECLHTVANGGYYISPRLSGHLIESNKYEQKPGWYNKLTAQELKILKLLSVNKTSKQIGDELFISTKTVENHRNNITTKLNLKGTNALLVFALENKQFFPG